MWELLKLSLSNQHHNRNISHCCCISSVSLYHDNNENMCKTFVTVWLKTEHYFCHQCPVNLKLTEKKNHAANDAVFSWLANRWPTVLWIRHWLCVCVFFCCCFFVCLCWLFSHTLFSSMTFQTERLWYQVDWWLTRSWSLFKPNYW